jgi:RNA polymerase sigma factor (sigma-70 family)
MEALAEQLVHPSDRSFEETFVAYGDRLVRRLAIIVGDAEQAQDLAQETFLRAVRHWPPVEGAGLYGWLVVVGVRLALNERRRRRRWQLRSVREEDATWAMETQPDLWQALATLDPKVRAALVLTALDGYTQEEAAQALGVPRGTLASWLSRARDRLRPILEETIP